MLLGKGMSLVRFGYVLLAGEVGLVRRYLLQLLCLSGVELKLVLGLLWLLVVMDAVRIERTFLSQRGLGQLVGVLYLCWLKIFVEILMSLSLLRIMLLL